MEPSPAELWFLICIPFMLIHFKTTFRSLMIWGLIFLPMLISMYVGSTIFGMYNSRFVIIDSYLFFLFLILISYFDVVKRELPKQNFFDMLMKAWFYAGFINILVVLVGYTTGSKILPTSIMSIIFYGIRARGFFKDPNVLGPFLIPVALYSLKTFIEERKVRFLNLPAFLFISLGVVFTFSRAAWLNYVVTLSVYLLYATLDKRATKRSVLFVLVLILLFVGFLYLSWNIYIFDTNLREFLMARAKLQSYDEDRFSTQAKFLDILSSTSILFGTGPGNYEDFTRMAAHSLYARYIAERGLFGFLTFFIFIIVIFRKAMKSDFRSFLIPVLMGQFVNSVFIDSLHWRHLWILLALSFI